MMEQEICPVEDVWFSFERTMTLLVLVDLIKCKNHTNYRESESLLFLEYMVPISAMAYVRTSKIGCRIEILFLCVI